MKTIEEKARAYDEVLNKLRHFIAKGVDPLITRADVQDFFSELAESEDEKVRQKILFLFYSWHNNEQVNIPNKKEVEKAISWLEKQGEQIDIANKEYWRGYREGKKLILDKYAEIEKQGKQKHENICSDCTNRKGCINCEDGNMKETLAQKPADKIEPKFKVGDKIYLKPEYRMPDDDTPIVNTVKEIRRIDDKHYRFDGSYIFIEDQDKYELVEQKPEENNGNIGGISANWSEEDGMILSLIVNSLKFIRDTLSHDDKYTVDVGSFEGQIEWLKSIQNRVQPQPKQEWSEEDKYMYDILCGTIENTDINENTKYKLISWLKSLRPQNNITDEELAQAKKNAYNDALDKIEYHSGEPTFDDGWSAAIDYIRKKSLRPQNKWKPSDEQMEALYKASKNEYLKADQYDVLLELWNNLKKLKEE